VKVASDQAVSPYSGVAPPVATRWQPGASANPGGRPKLQRSTVQALAELNDTEGANLKGIVAKFRASRGAKLCGADLKAIAAFRREQAKSQVGVSQLDSTLDRLEGKVTQTHVVGMDVRGAAERLADELGVSADELFAIASRLAEAEALPALPAVLVKSE
jgi:hypothetical protein